jgi:isocitrate lyase
MSQYQDDIKAVTSLKEQQGSAWNAINPESAARMRAQNKFKTGLDIAKYTAKIMRADMAAYDADPSQYTQSLGCWHGFIGQQKMISIKKHFNSTDRRYLYLSGWMVAALRSEFGPLPDQSMHEKTAVSALIKELYTFLRQADARELGGLFRQLDAAEGPAKPAIQAKIDNHVTHVVPIIADIDAGFGNAEATYLLAKQFIEAGACCIQVENQVSDEKQCGHQDGKVTVPHEDFLAKIRAIRYAFLELGVDDGIIVARTDSLGAGLTKQIAVTNAGRPGRPVQQLPRLRRSLGRRTGQWRRDHQARRQAAASKTPAKQPVPVPRRHRRGALRARLDHLAAKRRRPAVDRNRKTAYRPDRRHGQRNPQSDPERQAGVQQQPIVQLDPELPPAGVRRDESRRQGRVGLRACATDERGIRPDRTGDRRPTRKIRTFQADAAREAGIFHHLITLPTYHTAALSTDNLAKEYFGDQGMLGYVAGVQRKEIRQGIACVKHQNMSGSDIGDDHKDYFSGEAALKAAGKDNTMNQF